VTPAAAAIWPGESTTITVTADDGDGDPLSYTWSANGGQLTGTGATATWTAPSTGGSFTISVTVSDGRGGQAQDDTEVQAGATVRGTVISVTDGSPVRGVTVTIGGLSATTDAQGEFSILGVGQGTHTVGLTGNWFVAGNVTVSPSSPGQDVQVGDVPAADIGGGPPPPPF